MTLLWVAAALFGGMLIGATYRVDRRAEHETSELVRRLRARTHPVLAILDGGRS